MKDSDVFDFTDYRAYLEAALPVKGKERGARTRLAEYLGCQSGFISQVMTKHASFSLEHAMSITKFLKLQKAEREYFLLLVQRDRSGSKDLRDFYDDQIEAVQAKRKDISNRVSTPKSALTDADRQVYYSSWQHIAVHMCLVIPRLQTKRELASYLNLGDETITRILKDLESIHLAKLENGRYVGKYDRVHLAKDSPLIFKHHTNWRMRAIQSLDEAKPQDLHYSLVMSISPEVAAQMRIEILNLIQRFEPLIKESKDEDVVVFNLDLFKLSPKGV